LFRLLRNEPQELEKENRQDPKRGDVGDFTFSSLRIPITRAMGDWVLASAILCVLCVVFPLCFPL
jgi:hypothetical protein